MNPGPMEAEYEKLCRFTAEQWRSQEKPAGIWAKRAAHIHASKPAVVWRLPHPREGVVPEDCMTVLPSWEALSFWMRGYEEASAGRFM